MSVLRLYQAEGRCWFHPLWRWLANKLKDSGQQACERR
jgi:hypothetical protein